MSSSKPTVLFVDSHTWEAFSALAGALRMRGIGVRRVTSPPTDARAYALAQLDMALYGKARQIVTPGPREGAASAIAAADLPDLVAPNVIDVQAHDDLFSVIEAAPSPLTDPARRVGSGVDPAVLYDKLVLAETATQFGIPSPAVWVQPVARSFPVVVKTRVGFAGTGVRIAHDEVQLAVAWSDLMELSNEPPFLQAFHNAGSINSGGVAKDGDLIVSVAYDSRPAASDPNGPPLMVTAVSHPQVEELTEELVNRLGYTGFFNANWVVGESGTPLLIDFNARAFGSWPTLQACGVDFIGAYLYTLGLGPRPGLESIREGEFEGVLRFPFPAALSLEDVRRERRDALAIIAARRAWLGRRWAAVSRAKVELFAVAERVRLRRVAPEK